MDGWRVWFGGLEVMWDDAIGSGAADVECLRGVGQEQGIGVNGNKRQFFRMAFFGFCCVNVELKIGLEKMRIYWS